MSATLTERRFRLSDLSGQRRYIADLSSGDLGRSHTVADTIDHYLEKMDIPSEGVNRWTAVSRGVRLNNDTTLEELEQTDTDWLVVPEVSAG